MYELIQINDKQVKFEVVDTDIFTTSLDICEVFNKNHNHIIAKIEAFPQDEFSRTNFRPMSYKDIYNREQKMYSLTRDGFSMLAMGFTGTKAYEWKKQFIEAFNRMEAFIHRPQIPQPKLSPNQFTLHAISQMANEMLEIETKVQVTNERLDTLEQTSALTSSDCYAYQKAVEQKVWETLDKFKLDEKTYKPKLFSAIHIAIKKMYQVGSYKDLPHYKVEDLLADVRSLTPIIKMN